MIWGPAPLFAFTNSVHSFTIDVEGDADRVVVESANSCQEAKLVASGNWQADVATPTGGTWVVDAVAFVGELEVGRASITIPVVSSVPNEIEPEPRMDSTAQLAVLPWGDGAGEVGRLTPVEGEDREPVAMLYVADSDELAIVDDINGRIMFTDDTGQPTRTLPLELDIDGFVVDAVMIDDYQLLYAEIGHLDGNSAAVAHLVDVSNGSTIATAPMPIPGRPGSGQLHVDRTTHIIYFRFGDLWYPFLNLDRFELLVGRPATTGWTGRVSEDRFIGVESGPDYLFTTFPTTFPSVMQIETTSTTVFVLASYTVRGTGEDGALLARIPLDGSQSAITLVPLPRLWESSRTFTLRPTDIVLMVKTDEGLALYSAPVT